MRILAGKWKSRLLNVPKTDSTRPTSAVLRAALFNILQDSIEGAHFLDICAGSGAIGLEALSRGAELTVFIENQKNALDSLKKNIAALEASQSQLLGMEALSALRHLARKKNLFDIAFIDPPYAEKALLTSILLALPPVMHPEGAIFIETDSPTLSSASWNSFKGSTGKSLDVRRFGDSFLLKIGPEGAPCENGAS